MNNNTPTPFDIENIQAEREQYEAEQAAELEPCGICDECVAGIRCRELSPDAPCLELEAFGVCAACGVFPEAPPTNDPQPPAPRTPKASTHTKENEND